MQISVRTFLLVFSLWASQSGAATIAYFGTATETSDLLQALFMTDSVDIYAEFEFDASPGAISNNPDVLVDARVVIGAIPAIGLCYSVEYVSCTDIVTSQAMRSLWVRSVESLAFDESAIPVAGILTLASLTRSPWPTDIVFDFSTNQWKFEVFLFANANGSFTQVVPLPGAFYLFGSALLWMGGIATRRRLRSPDA